MHEKETVKISSAKQGCGELSPCQRRQSPHAEDSSFEGGRSFLQREHAGKGFKADVSWGLTRTSKEPSRKDRKNTERRIRGGEARGHRGQMNKFCKPLQGFHLLLSITQRITGKFGGYHYDLCDLLLQNHSGSSVENKLQQDEKESRQAS